MQLLSNQDILSTSADATNTPGKDKHSDITHDIILSIPISVSI